MTRKSRRELERALDDLERPTERVGVLVVGSEESDEYLTADEVEQRCGRPPAEVAELVVQVPAAAEGY